MNAGKQADEARLLIQHYMGKWQISEAQFAQFTNLDADRLAGFMMGAIPALNQPECLKLGEVIKEAAWAEKADAEVEKFYGRPHTTTGWDLLAGK